MRILLWILLGVNLISFELGLMYSGSDVLKDYLSKFKGDLKVYHWILAIFIPGLLFVKPTKIIFRPIFKLINNILNVFATFIIWLFTLTIKKDN